MTFPSKIVSRPALAAAFLACVVVVGAAWRSSHRLASSDPVVVAPEKHRKSSRRDEEAAAAALAKFYKETQWGFSRDRKANDSRWAKLLIALAEKYPGTIASADAYLDAAKSLHQVGADEKAVSIYDQVAAGYASRRTAALVAKAELLMDVKQVSDAVAILEPLRSEKAGTDEGAQANLSYGRALELQGRVEEAKRLYAEIAHDRSASAKSRFLGEYRPILANVNVLHGGPWMDSDGRPVKLTLDESNALWERTKGQFQALLGRYFGPSASIDPNARLALQSTDAQTAANDAAYQYGLWLYSYLNFADAANAFGTLASSPTGADYVTPSMIMEGASQYMGGQFGQAENTLLASLARPDLDAVDLATATAWKGVCERQLALVPLPTPPPSNSGSTPLTALDAPTSHRHEVVR